MDRKQCIKLLGLVVLLLCASSARAQFPNTYHTVNSYGYDPNTGTIDPATGTTPGTVTLTVAFSGSTTGTQQMNNSGIKHTPYIYATLNNHTKSAVGPQFAPATNMAWSQSFSFDLMGDGCDWALLNAGACVIETKPEIQCPIYGFIHIPWTDIEFEMAATSSYISALLTTNGMHPEAEFCSDRSLPPDWPGPTEALPGTPSGQVVNIAFLYREFPLGTNPTGIRWQRAFPTLQRIGVGYYTNPTFDPPDCTNKDRGVSGYPLPPPMIPQP